jgi:hypothetical protein
VAGRRRDLHPYQVTVAVPEEALETVQSFTSGTVAEPFVPPDARMVSAHLELSNSKAWLTATYRTRRPDGTLLKRKAMRRIELEKGETGSTVLTDLFTDSPPDLETAQAVKAFWPQGTETPDGWPGVRPRPSGPLHPYAVCIYLPASSHTRVLALEPQNRSDTSIPESAEILEALLEVTKPRVRLRVVYRSRGSDGTPQKHEHHTTFTFPKGDEAANAWLPHLLLDPEEPTDPRGDNTERAVRPFWPQTRPGR